MRDAIARGEVPPGVDADELGRLATMLLDGALVAVAEEGDAMDRDAVRDRVVRAVAALSGLGRATD